MSVGVLAAGDRAGRAVVAADAAAGALVIINDREVVDDLDRMAETFPLAQPAPDAAVTAHEPDRFAGRRGGAAHVKMLGGRAKGDQMIRTCGNTQPARNAFSGLDIGETVFQADRAVRAGAHTVAKPDAAVRAAVAAAEMQLCTGAGFDALIVAFAFC